MKNFASVVAVLAFLAAQPAFALEQSASIKVTRLMQTPASWNGAASFGYVLEGELEVSLKDGSTRRVVAGQALAEVVNTLHNGRNVGKGPVKLVVFYAGVTGSTLTIKE
jgi:hypothetical protein